MRKIEIRITEVKYTGSLTDYTIEELEEMAKAKMYDRGDWSPDEIKEVSDEEAQKMDGAVWIENHLPCNKLVYIGMSNIYEELDEEEEGDEISDS